MQPNGNVPGVGRPVAGAPMNNVNAKPAPVPTPPPTPAPKPAEPAFGNGGSVVEGKGGKKTGWILAVVFLLIVAAGGVGFGVWAMMDGNAQKETLNSQISALKKENNELQEKVGNAETDLVDVDTDGEITSTEDYIYIGAWGLKIKIPESLTMTGYKYSMLAGYTSVSVWGSSKGGQYFPEFADSSKNADGLGMIARYPKGTELSQASAPQLVFSDNNYDYYYYHWQVAYSAESGDESEQSWEQESREMIESMLTNSDNYSKI